MQFTFGDKREVHLLDESVLPVTEKERRGEGKSSIGPRMKYGHANHKSNCPYTNGRCSVSTLPLLSLYDIMIVSLCRALSIRKHKHTTTYFGRPIDEGPIQYAWVVLASALSDL